MKIDIEHMGDVQFSITTRGHVIYSDQPEDNNGYDEGMTPPEIFVGALGACAAFYAVAYLKRKGLPHEGTRVEAYAEKLQQPSRLGDLVLRVFTPSALSEEEGRGVHESVAKCILHNTLMHPPVIRTEIVPSVAALEAV